MKVGEIDEKYNNNERYKQKRLVLTQPMKEQERGKLMKQKAELSKKEEELRKQKGELKKKEEKIRKEKDELKKEKDDLDMKEKELSKQQEKLRNDLISAEILLLDQPNHHICNDRYNRFKEGSFCFC